MPTNDNQLAILTAGSSDWDSDTDDNFQILERGYHITERAGQAISSGQVLTLNSGGFFKPYDPGISSMPPAAYAFTAAASGDSLQALAWGIVRSLDVNSLGAPGKVAYSTPSGFLTTVASGLPVGIFTTGRGILFNPDHAAGAGGAGASTLGALTDVDTTGLANDSILKWSNTSSKFVVAVDSGGGGGGGGGGAVYPFAPPVVSSFSMVGSPLSINSTPAGTAMYLGSCSAGDKLNGYVMNLGTLAAPWSVTVGFVAFLPATNFASVGMCLTDKTKFHTFWMQHNSGLFYASNRFSDRNTFDSNAGGNQSFDFPPRYWRITDTGSQYIMAVSPDGFNFMDVLTQTNSYLNTSSPLYAGFIGDCGASSGDIFLNAEYFNYSP